MKRIRFREVKRAVIDDFITNCEWSELTKEYTLRDFRSCKCIEDLVHCLEENGFRTHEAYEFIVDTITRD